MATAFALRASLGRVALTGARSCITRGSLARSVQLSTPKPWRGFSSSSALREKKYTEDHEWIELSDDGASAKIGISTYAASALGDVVYVELPAADVEFSAGDSIGAVESVKSASDIMAPVSGTVIESNSALEEKPGHINNSPEDDAWLAKIKISDPAELEGLMDAEAYRAHTDEASKS